MKFSVIIPSYNYGHFIKECLDSVVAQTYQDWECFIIDNGSTDDTEQVCKSYLEDQRFTYIRSEINKGPSPARNIALKQCTGEYVLFLDADDLIESNKLASAKRIIDRTGCDLVFTDFHYFSKDPSKIHKAVSFNGVLNAGMVPSGTITAKLINGNIFAISCVVTKKCVLEKADYFDEKINFNEDWDLWLRIALNNATYYYDNNRNVETLIRDHGTSHSKDSIVMYLSGLYVCKKNLSLLKEKEAEIFKAKIASHRYTLERLLLDQCKKGESAHALLEKLDNEPLAEGELTIARKILKTSVSLYSFYLFLSKIKHVITE